MNKILVIGQTPPPFGGQAVMINHLIQGDYSQIKLYHVRMTFSRGMEDMGKFQLRKFFHVFTIIFKAYYFRIFKQVKILYYPPSGANSAVYRDIMVLYPIRFLFKKTIFHFHASGLSTHLENKNPLFKYAFKVSFNKPDLCIHLSESCPKEGEYINSRKNEIVPNGIPDIVFQQHQISSKTFNILFLGLLEESKGEFDILQAIKLLKERQLKIKFRFYGQFKSVDYKEKFFNYIQEYNLSNEVEYLGIIKGKEKHKIFESSDCFCFPTYFHSESFPLVLLEAMAYSLPIITTKWRGIPDMVTEGYNGVFADRNSPISIAEKIEYLINNEKERIDLGNNGRKLFEDKYEIKQHLKAMEQVLGKV
jgi:glycosyltransferase involved in cell wall biosynthesis